MKPFPLEKTFLLDQHCTTYMNRTELSKILLVQAMEESDQHGRHLPLSTRHHATQQARDQQDIALGASKETSLTFLTRRSDIIWAFVKKSFPTFIKPWKHIQIGIPSALVAFPALVAGLLMNGLGGSQRVNLLNFPLLALLLWNVGIFLSSAVVPFLPSSLKNAGLGATTTWLSQFVEWWGRRSWSFSTLSDPSATLWVKDSTKRFMTLWLPHIRPIWTQRVRQLLHLGAACMALGIILGMYIRGLALDYQATWESTFLSPTQVHSILSSLLGPAAWLLHYPFPSLADIVNLRAPQHGPAASWIHMWALTAFAIIVIPRCILAWLCQRSVQQMHRTCILSLEDPYFVHLLAPGKGQGMHVDVLPYSYQPSAEAKNFLDLVFLDIFGNLANLHWHPTVPFGQEYSALFEASVLTRTIVVIFNAGQTPEGEVHGEWLHTMQTQLSTASNTRLLVLLDEEPYSQIVDDVRMTERRQSWQRLGIQYQLSFVTFHPSTTPQNKIIQQAQTRLWPASS